MVVGSGANNSYAKEISIRKRISNIFNKREDDFPSLRDYNDYLEEVEDLTFNLIEGINVPAIETRIAKYQEENGDQIMNARARRAEELAAALAASKGGIAHTDVGNGVIQSSQVGVSVGGQMQYAPAMPGIAFGQPRPTGMAPQPVPVGSGHDMHGFATDDEEMMELRARAGGWSLELSKRRAIEEAFGSMWI
ncbi:hypothetical protein IFM89_024687 [Coptis chinensis]|uniref:MAT1 centre domain-containing protein n=1 Tax=Coptis chinensis TaxID=261450 RepID=A0A835IH38_9MAGN|nr:hypothetical protein IFM89_024687 [Coptis chinensis]